VKSNWQFLHQFNWQLF